MSPHKFVTSERQGGLFTSELSLIAGYCGDNKQPQSAAELEPRPPSERSKKESLAGGLV